MKFSLDQVKKLSDICADISQVFLGTIVVPFFIDKVDLQMLALGSIASLSFWFLSIRFLGKIR